MADVPVGKFVQEGLDLGKKGFQLFILHLVPALNLADYQFRVEKDMQGCASILYSGFKPGYKGLVLCRVVGALSEVA